MSNEHCVDFYALGEPAEVVNLDSGSIKYDEEQLRDIIRPYVTEISERFAIELLQCFLCGAWEHFFQASCELRDKGRYAEALMLLKRARRRDT